MNENKRTRSTDNTSSSPLQKKIDIKPSPQKTNEMNIAESPPPAPAPPPLQPMPPPAPPATCSNPLKIIEQYVNKPCNKPFYFYKKTQNEPIKEVKSIECFSTCDLNETDECKEEITIIIRDKITGKIDGKFKPSSCDFKNFMENYVKIEQITDENIEEKYANYPLYQTNFSKFHKQLDTLYSLQLSNNYFDSIDDIFYILNTSLKTKESIITTPITDCFNLPEIKIEPPTTLENFINTSERPEAIKNEIKTTMYFYSFIRSYIDFYHDFVYHAITQAKNIRRLLENSPFYAEFKKLNIDSILDSIDEEVITSSGYNINQTECKKKIKYYMEEYCKKMIELGVYWLTPNKESAFVCSADTTNQEELKILIEQLKNDSIETFFTETDKSHISDILTNNNFGMMISQTGKWDAGTRFGEKSFKERRKNVLNTTVDKLEYIYRRYNPSDESKVEKQNNSYFIQNNANSLVSQYLFLDLFKIYANNNSSENNLTLEDTYNPKTDIKPLELKSTKEKNKIKLSELSVNALSASVGIEQSRGEARASAIPTIKNSSLSTTAILSLKTFGDFVQLLDIHDIKNQKKCVFITLDYLCDDSGMFFGLPTIRSEIGFVSYYCYDTRYHSINLTIMKRKLNVFCRIANNYEKLKTHMKENIFNPIKNYFINIKKLHYDPSIYYAAQFLLGEIENIQESALNKLKEVKAKFDEFKKTGLSDENINYIKLFPINNDKFVEWANMNNLTLEQGEMNINEHGKLINFNGDFETYIEQICQFSIIKGTFISISKLFTNLIVKIFSVPNRIRIDDFKEFYYNIKQELINFLKKETDENTINLNFIVIFSVIFSMKNIYAQNAILQNMDELISVLMLEIQKLELEQNQTNIENIKIEIEKIKIDIENIKKIKLCIILLNKIFKKDEEKFKVKVSEIEKNIDDYDKDLVKILDQIDDLKEDHEEFIHQIVSIEEKYNENPNNKELFEKGIQIEQKLTEINNKIKILEEEYRKIINIRYNLLKDYSRTEESHAKTITTKSGEELFKIPYIENYFQNDFYYQYYQQFTSIESYKDDDNKISYFALPYQLIYKILDSCLKDINIHNINDYLSNSNKQDELLNTKLNTNIFIKGVQRTSAKKRKSSASARQSSSHRQSTKRQREGTPQKGGRITKKKWRNRTKKYRKSRKNRTKKNTLQWCKCAKV